MAVLEAEWAADRLPDGTVRRRDERAAAATVASDALLAAGMKAAAAFAAIQLADPSAPRRRGRPWAGRRRLPGDHHHDARVRICRRRGLGLRFA